MNVRDLRILWLVVVCVILSTFQKLNAQNKILKAYGFRHITFHYQGDPVDILIKSKKGEENIPKPLFLFCQGSQPNPLIIRFRKNGTDQIYPVFVFNTDSLSKDYHLVIIGKPYVPLMAEEDSLNKQLAFVDNKGLPTEPYKRRNYLDYYVNRNIAILRSLRKSPWVTKNKLVVAGHSEGAAIASKIAYKYSRVTELIYASGSPLGRMASVVAQARKEDTDSSPLAEEEFKSWIQITADPNNLIAEGDSNKDTYQSSSPAPITWITRLKIPTLIVNGTKDVNGLFANDYLRLEAIRLQKPNLTFKSYIGLEHNFFAVKPSGKIDYDQFGWDKVANDWYLWLKKN